MKKQGKKDIRSIATKQILLNSIHELLEQKPFDDITVADICAKAGVSKTTFYNYFEDKYILTLEWVHAAIKPPTELFTDETLELYFEQLLYSEERYQEQINHIVYTNGYIELQWRIATKLKECLQSYFDKKQAAGHQYIYSTEMMAVYNTAGIITLISWYMINRCSVPKHIIIQYLVNKVRQATDLTCPDHNTNER